MTTYDRKLYKEKMLLTVDDYHRMAAAGIFDGKPRVELLNGELLTMSPLSPQHNGHVDKINRFLSKLLPDNALVRVQGSIRLDDHSEPEPDIAILRYDETFHSENQVQPKDIYLVVEVAIATIMTDQEIKKAKYASAQIPEYWIVLPEEGIVEVYRSPKGDDYQEKRTYGKEGTWMFAAFSLPVKGSDLLI